MKLEDIFALAKQGYKPQDIKDLIALAEPEQAPKEPQEPTPTEPAEPTPTEPAEPTPTEPAEPDYKSLYEDSQKKLKEAQQANIKQNIKDEQNTKSDTDLFNEICKSFM